METQTSFKNYARAVRKRWWLLALLAIIDVGGVQRSISATSPRGTNLIRIEASATTPQGAADLANGAAAELSNFFRQTNAADAGRAREFVVQQLAEVQQRLDASDRALIAGRQNPANL